MSAISWLDSSSMLTHMDMGMSIDMGVTMNQEKIMCARAVTNVLFPFVAWSVAYWPRSVIRHPMASYPWVLLLSCVS